MEVEFPYKCPLVGKCSSSCGNGIFQGKDLSIGYTTISEGEECDDGNNMNSDGCNSACEVEKDYTCVNVFQKLVYEIPIFKSTCTKSSGSNGGGDTSSTNVYYRVIVGNTELDFTKYSVRLENLSGHFRIIEHDENE